LQETFLLEGDISPAGTIDMFPRGIELAVGADGAGDTANGDAGLVGIRKGALYSTGRIKH
jgi:hypothetical protein